jgi:hypothetical protein
MASSEFPLFPELPAELRLQIWALAIPHRVLPITCTKGILSPSARRYAQRFTSTSPPPSLLLCCRESRSVALPVYSSYFRTEASPHGIHASFAYDTISFPENTINYLGREETEGIERMVLEIKDHAYFGYFNLSLLRGMRALKELELRVENGVSYAWGPAEAANDIIRDLKTEALEYRDWKMPEVVRIVRAGTGQELHVIRGRGDLLEEEEEV